MLKPSAKKFVIASLLSVTMLVTVPLDAFAAALSASNLSQLQTVITSEMTARDTSFVINYTGSATNIANDLSTVTKAAKNSNDYLNNSWSSLSYNLVGVSGNMKITFNATYLTTAAQEAYVDSTVTQALASIITPGLTDFQKERAIHTWILNKLSYDYTLINHSAYAGLAAPNKTVCQGYALLMYKMLTQAGITTKIITGTLNGGAHGWNMVNIGGKWYHVDATNDDILQNKYYNVTDSVLSQNGFAWDKKAYPSATTSYVEGSTPTTPTPTPVTVVTLSKTTASLTVKSTTTLVATSKPTKTVTWKSSNPAVVSVKNGTLTGVSAGTATVTVTTQDNATATCKVTVTAPAVQSKVTLSKSTLALTKGGTSQLTAAITYLNSTQKPPSQLVVWKSNNTSIVTITNGVVKGVKAGTTTITASTQDGKATASCTVTVK